MSERRKVVIDRNIWLRGEGGESSYLLCPTTDRRCCVGIYLAACGVKDGLLLGNKTALDLYAFGGLPREADWLTATSLVQVVGLSSATGILGLYGANDAYHLSEAEREGAVKATFAKYGVDVEFINGVDPNAQKES